MRYALKTPSRDGTTHGLFEPLDFMAYIPVRHPFGAACGIANRQSCRFVIARLAALIPRPGANLTRCHGVFAPNSHVRAQVTPARRGQRPPSATTATDPEKHRAMTRARRLERVFEIEVEVCEQCGGEGKILACIERPNVIDRILGPLRGKHSAATGSRPQAARAPPGAAAPSLFD